MSEYEMQAAICPICKDDHLTFCTSIAEKIAREHVCDGVTWEDDGPEYTLCTCGARFLTEQRSWNLHIATVTEAAVRAEVEPNRLDAEDCQACASVEDRPCLYHEGMAMGWNDPDLRKEALSARTYPSREDIEAVLQEHMSQHCNLCACPSDIATAILALPGRTEAKTLPVVAHKGPQDTVAAMFAKAADNLERGYPLGGSNLTDAVVRLIRREIDRARADEIEQGVRGDGTVLPGRHRDAEVERRVREVVAAEIVTAEWDGQYQNRPPGGDELSPWMVGVNDGVEFAARVVRGGGV